MITADKLLNGLKNETTSAEFKGVLIAFIDDYKKLQQDNERHKDLNRKLANHNADYNAENLKLKQACEVMREALELYSEVTVYTKAEGDMYIAWIALEKVKGLLR